MDLRNFAARAFVLFDIFRDMLAGTVKVADISEELLVFLLLLPVTFAFEIER